MKRMRPMPFGATLTEDGATRFRLWAPDARRVTLDIESAQGARLNADLDRGEEGWYELELAGMGTGSRYRYRIDDELDVPDPASRYNPDGVQDHSLVVDPGAYEWSDTAWRGRPWHEQVLYELHVGTFTREGTYAAIADKLDVLRELGVTAIELMPIGAWSGRRGWGYDGVLPFAPHASYGKPEDLKRLIEAAHERGLSMLLDVVYNHFGPEGNYLPRYAREFYTRKHRTPWGDAIDLQHPVVRQFFLENALYWLEEYHFDGLRLDAVHAMRDDSPRHFVDELIDRVQQGPGTGRHVHVVLENHANEVRRLRKLTAQWNDDFHHPLHVLLTGERDGYYRDYAQQPVGQIGRALAQGFAFQGDRSIVSGEPRGERSDELSPAAFVSFLQNHDQIGNRAFGERLQVLADPAALRAGLAILLLSPQIPMLFMGEEYAASQPFLYFCDYQGELAHAIAEGRRSEFASFAAFENERERGRIPDPNAQSTFLRSRLDWSERKRLPHSAHLAYVHELLSLRSRHIAPLIPDIDAKRSTYEVRGQVVSVAWRARSGRTLSLTANLGATPVADAAAGEVLFRTPDASTDPEQLAAWEARLRLSAA
jgi:maltooligosyltrehalose trehalohydrolase